MSQPRKEVPPMPANDAREQYEANRQNVAGRSKAPAKPKGGKGKTLIRLLRTLFSFYPKLLPLVFCCLVTNSILSALPATFMQRALEVVTATWESGDWASASRPHPLHRAHAHLHLRCVAHAELHVEPHHGHRHAGLAREVPREGLRPHAATCPSASSTRTSAATS